jgi:hypothetical protein
MWGIQMATLTRIQSLFRKAQPSIDCNQLDVQFLERIGGPESAPISSPLSMTDCTRIRVLRIYMPATKLQSGGAHSPPDKWKRRRLKRASPPPPLFNLQKHLSRYLDPARLRFL